MEYYVYVIKVGDNFYSPAREGMFLKPLPECLIGDETVAERVLSIVKQNYPEATIEKWKLSKETK